MATEWTQPTTPRSCGNAPTTHSEDCWRWHADCALERGRRQGRADERAKLAAELRSIADNPNTMSQWLNAHGLSGVSDTSAARVLLAYAGELDARLGGYTGTNDG